MTMKNDNEQTTAPAAISADLQRQREYIKELETQMFDYGLVLGNAFVKGMRDIGYKSTAYALNELNDNSIQAGARNIHVAFGYEPRNKSKKKLDMLAIIDDGHGMDPMMIRAAVIWGGTHRQNDRSGFGRYGYGLPSACVSIGKRYTVFSRVDGADWHKVTVDLDDIEQHFRKSAGTVHVEPPTQVNPPVWALDYIKTNLKHFRSGTVIIIEKIDRLDHSTVQTLRGDLLQDFGTTYRNFLGEVSMAVDAEPVEPTDPLFLTSGFRFYDVDSDRAEALPSLEIEVRDKESKEDLGTVKVRFSLMPPTFLRVPDDKLKPKGGKNNPRFNIRKANNGVIVLRAGRQIDVVSAKCPWTTFQNNDRYVGIEVDFPPSLDEEFSITTSKQQVVLKPRIWNILHEHGVLTAIESMRGKYKKAAAEVDTKAKDKDGKRPSEAAIETAEKLFAQAPTEPTPEQQQKSEENLNREADKLAEQASIPPSEAKKLLEAKAKTYPYKVELVDAPGAPFYRMEQRGGQRVLFINKAHRFYTALYASSEATPHVRYALESLLFVMGGCEIRSSEDRQMFYEQERHLWSVNLNTTLKALEEWNTAEDIAHSVAEANEVTAYGKERQQAAAAVPA
jgi:hypothetical protein